MTAAVPNARAALTAARRSRRAAMSSIAGSSMNSAFCQRIAIISPAPNPSRPHRVSESDPGDPDVSRIPPVAAHAHTNAATAAIDGAWLIDGSFTRYQSMNDPASVIVVAPAATPASKNSRARRQQHQAPSRP
jgi:hypothetical protein